MLKIVLDDDGTPVVIPALIDYECSYADLMIDAEAAKLQSDDGVVVATRYRYPDPDLTEERFFVRGTGQQAYFFRLLEVTPGRKVSSETVFACLREFATAHRLRPVTYLEMLTVAAANPQLPDRQMACLAALDAVREIPGGGVRRSYVPVIRRYNDKRYLEPHRLDDDFPWNPGDRFLMATLDAEVRS